MSDMMSGPAIQDIVAGITQEAQFRERNDWIAWARGHLDRTRDPVIPGLEDLQIRFHSPKPKKDAHGYTNKLIAAPITIQIAAQVGAGGQETETALKRAQNYENLCYRLWARWKEREVIDDAAFNMVALKRGHLHLFLSRELIPLVPQPEDGEGPSDYEKRIRPILDEFQKGDKSNLIDLESVPPEAVFWTPDRSCKIIAARVPVNPLATLYAQSGAGGYAGEAGKGKSITVNKQGEIAVMTIAGAEDVRGGEQAWSQMVTLYIVESADYCYHMLFDGYDAGDGKWAQGKKGELIGCYKNYFGVPAIFDINGEPAGRDHALHGRSALIEGLYETEPLRTALGTLIMDGAIVATQQQKTLEMAEGEWAMRERDKNPDAQPSIRLDKNGIRSVTPGWKLSPYRDLLPADVLNAFTIISQESDAMGYPRILGAPEEFDAKSGYDRAKGTDAVSSQLDPPLERIAGTMNQVWKAVGNGIDALGIDLPVGNVYPTAKLGAVPRHVQKEIVITPEDVQGNPDIITRFDSKTQYSKLAEVEQAQGLVQIGWMSETQAFTDVLRYDDPDRVRQEINQDKMRKLADQKAFEDAAALFESIAPIIEGEALEQANVAGLVNAAKAQMAAQPSQNGTQSSALAAEMQPMTEPAPNPMAELGMTGGT